MRPRILLFIFSCSAVSLFAQSNKEKYEQASDVVQIAIQKLHSGDVNNANALVDSAMKIYPTRGVIDYARELFLFNNQSEAFNYLDKLWLTANALEGDNITIYDPPQVVRLGKKRKITKWKKSTGIFHLMNEAHELNRQFGTITFSKLLMGKIVSLDIHRLDRVARSIQQEIRIKLAIEEKRFNEAFQLAGDKEYNYLKAQWEVYILFKQKEYQLALKKVNDYGQVRLPNYRSWKFTLNVLLGNNTEALKAYNKNEGADNNETFYYLALMQLNDQNYDSALVLLNKALNFRVTGKDEDFAQYFLMDRYLVYKSIGDAYAGLKQYDKARDNYNVAILANPDYEPAIAALTKLESTIATTTSTDKTPPKIAVTEPSVKRGLQVITSGNDVMVRGIAEDPSGLKSVSINGQSVYAQASGNFWGNIVLKDGLNKIIIKATDGAGNIAEETFEITKNNTPANETEIIAVTAKEGKNYCLLIAAQNYSDATIPSLENPIQDAVRLKLVLKKSYRFADEEIFTLFNPSANDIKRQLLELTNIIQPEDNLLIFYAGHGIWVEKEKKGYWLMTDANRNDPTTWVSNKEVLNLIAKLPAKHTLLITDACFSGGVFKTRSISKDAPSAIQMMDAKVSRVAITSGNDTEVPDQSVFMKYLVKALSENKEQYLPAQKMFITHIMEAVMTEGKTEPRYGTLELAGHVGGDFIFTKK